MLLHDTKKWGGLVRWHGKPHKEIYAQCQKIADLPETARGIAVGDSLAHDITGAQNMGMDTIFITSGIHKKHFLEGTNKEKLQELLEEYSIKPPTYFMEYAR